MRGLAKWLLVGGLSVAGCGDDGSTGTTDGGTTTGTTTTGTATTGTATTGTTGGSTSGGVNCGNGVLDGDEECDAGDQNGAGMLCKADCTLNVCGDGDKGPGEGCDDGNAIDEDDCSNACVPATCGDGRVQDREDCDDGNADDTDECLSNCAAAACGDGVVQAGVEGCDDANVDNTDACVEGCVAAACGDGFVQDGVEACDDANVDNTDACVDGCLAASCGDGFVQMGVEDCDDGNTFDEDLCTNACVACTEGCVLWTRTYNSPANDLDAGKGVAVDSVGNVVAVGWEGRPDLGPVIRLWVRKYDPDGNTLWTETYNPNQGGAFGEGVAIDPDDNVVVAGYEATMTENDNAWVRKYDPDGNTIWTRSYNSPGNLDDHALAVAVDASANVVATGRENRNDVGQNFNVFVRKWDPNGNVLWTRTHNGLDDSDDMGYGVATDANRNVLVAGQEARFDLGQAINIWVRKYDDSGNVLWTRSYDSPGNSYDFGRGVATDASDNVLVVGTEDVQSGNIWVRKYGPGGNTLWTETHDSVASDADAGRGVAVDADGNVLVAGIETRSDLGQQANIWVRKYDSAGNELWTRSHNSLGDDVDFGEGIAADAEGNVLVAGMENANELVEDGNIWVRKYTP